MIGNIMDHDPVLVFLIAVVGLVALTALVLHFLPPPRPKKLKPARNIRVTFIKHLS
jgi:hypothetical protein